MSTAGTIKAAVQLYLDAQPPLANKSIHWVLPTGYSTNYDRRACTKQCVVDIINVQLDKSEIDLCP